MTQLFDDPPGGLQAAPDDLCTVAADTHVSVSEVDFRVVHDKPTLMTAFEDGLALARRFGHNWDALYDVLTDPQPFPARDALLLRGYARFRRTHGRLARQLEDALLDAQAEAARQGRRLWLLVEDAGSARDDD